MSYNIIDETTVLTAGSEAGLVNNSTVVLDVDTTSGAISITLPVISTFTYPFGITYIIHDYAGTAATNAITILAGEGNEINNAASVLLNTTDGTIMVTASGLTDWAAVNQMGGLPIVANTATSDGLTTGIIANGNCFVNVTSANANNIIVLPAPIPGTRVLLRNAGTGYELRSSSPTTVGINGGTGANVESAVAANIFVIMYCDTATSWIGTQFTTAGVQSAVEVAA